MHRPAQIAYASLYASKFVLWGIALPFFSGWLALKGFSAPDIGLITGAALGARLLLGPAVAWWSDRQPDQRRALRFIAFLFAASAVCLAFAPAKPAIVASSVILLWSFGLLIPLTDSLVLAADRAGLVHYGQTRAVGSVSFLATTILGGEALTRFGLSTGVAIMAVAGASTFIVSLLLPRASDGEARRAAPSWRDARKLVGEPRFLMALGAAGLTQSAHAVYYSFSILHWTALGYSPRVIGALWATGVVAEILLLTRARSLVSRLRPDLLIALGAGGAAARWLFTAGDPVLPLLFAVQMFHALSFSATHIGTIEFIDRAAPKRLVTTAMTLHSTAGVGALTGLATIAAGYVFQAYGAGAAYLLMAAIAATGAALALLLSRRWKGEALFA
ncbi:MAG: MFS transporter [Amphiplicatus sp.]